MDAIVANLAASHRPLVICDIDEVVLEFIDPLQDFLASVDHRLHADSYRLTGNVRRIDDGTAASREQVSEFQEAFFAAQHQWQRPARDAKRVLDGLAQKADVVFLTAMPPRHQQARRALLDSLALTYPMIATEDAKGPIVARLIGDRRVRAAFIDDIHTNHASVRDFAPGCLLISLMASQAFRALAPHPGDDVVVARDWAHTGAVIEAHFGADATEM